MNAKLLLSVYSPFSDRVGLPNKKCIRRYTFIYHFLHSPSPINFPEHNPNNSSISLAD